MNCKYIEDLKKQIKIYFISIIILILIIISGILVFFYHNIIFKYLTNETINTIILSATLITTIICFNIDKKKSITIQKKVRDQEKFEEEIDKILGIYPLIIQDYINSNLDYNINHMEQNEDNIGTCVFDISSIDRYNLINAKYICELQSINNRLNYFYKYQKVSHPEFDKFQIKLQDINNSIINDITNISNWVNELLKCHNIEKANDLLVRRGIFLNNITQIYSTNIGELYLLANNCIEERANISINY